MRLAIRGACLATLAFTHVQAAPTATTHRSTEALQQESRPPGLLLDARRGYTRPRPLDQPSAGGPNKKVKGKEKLLDSSFQLDQYLSTDNSRHSRVSSRHSSDSGARLKQAHSSKRIKTASTSNSKVADSAKGAPAKSHKEAVPRSYSSRGGAPGSSSKSRRADSRLQHRDRKKDFMRQWDLQKLNTDMHPELLAEKVFGFRAHDISPHTIGTHAPALVRLKGDKDYLTRYALKTRQMSHFFSETRTRLLKNSAFKEMDKRAQMAQLLDQTVRHARGEKLKRTLNVKDPQAPVAFKKVAAMRIERVGKLAQEHLQKKELNFFSIPLDKIEEETRDFRVPGMRPEQSTRLLNRFVQHRRSEEDVDMARIRLARHNFNSKRCREKACEEEIGAEESSSEQ